MARFFLPKKNIADGKIVIRGDDAAHITFSLRMRVGDSLVICDMQKTEYRCVISDMNSQEVLLDILSTKTSENEPPYQVSLYQALPKGDKMDYIVQKAVENGVFDIIPFVSERCISRPDVLSLEKKCARWQKIAEEAAKQCGRGIVPEVKKAISMKELLSRVSLYNRKLFCYEGDGTRSIKECLFASRISTETMNFEETIMLVIGPEGGFSMSEVQQAQASGMELAGLGKRILRCETASGFALACICYQLEL